MLSEEIRYDLNELQKAHLDAFTDKYYYLQDHVKGTSSHWYVQDMHRLPEVIQQAIKDYDKQIEYWPSTRLQRWLEFFLG